MTNLNWVEGDAVRLSTKYYYLILANYEFSFSKTFNRAREEVKK